MGTEKEIAEGLKIHKQTQRVSAADEFESLAYSITVGECTEYNRARAESYLKAAYALRQEESVVDKNVTALVAQVLDWAKLRKIQITPVQVLKLVQGREVTALDTTYRANQITGELIVTGADMNWRKTLARHRVDELLSRWRKAIE